MSEGQATRKEDLSKLLSLRLVGAQVSVLSGPDAGRLLQVGATGILIGTGSACDRRAWNTL
jgi:hypothetical protein